MTVSRLRVLMVLLCAALMVLSGSLGYAVGNRVTLRRTQLGSGQGGSGPPVRLTRAVDLTRQGIPMSRTRQRLITALDTV